MFVYSNTSAFQPSSRFDSSSQPYLSIFKVRVVEVSFDYRDLTGIQFANLRLLHEDVAVSCLDILQPDPRNLQIMRCPHNYSRFTKLTALLTSSRAGLPSWPRNSSAVVEQEISRYWTRESGSGASLLVKSSSTPQRPSWCGSTNTSHSTLETRAFVIPHENMVTFAKY
jgi:hypothetical protein